MQPWVYLVIVIVVLGVIYAIKDFYDTKDQEAVEAQKRMNARKQQDEFWADVKADAEARYNRKTNFALIRLHLRKRAYEIKRQAELEYRAVEDETVARLYR